MQPHPITSLLPPVLRVFWSGGKSGVIFGKSGVQQVKLSGSTGAKKDSLNFNSKLFGKRYLSMYLLYFKGLMIT